MSDNLQPCPFCGDAMLHSENIGIVHHKQGRCPIGQIGFVDREAWNRRSDLIPAMIEAAVAPLRAALQEIQLKAFRQTDIGENHASGISGTSDRLCFLKIRDIAAAAIRGETP